MNTQAKIELKELIAENKIAQAIDALQKKMNTYLAESHSRNINDLYDMLIINKGKWNSIVHEENLGIADPAFSDIEKSKIKKAYLYIVEKLPDDFFTPHHQKVKDKAEKEQLQDGIEELKKNNEFEFDIFMSFSSKDRDFAKPVWETLRGYGLRVFLSDETLKSNVGMSYAEKIQYALTHSKHFLLICSPHAMDSGWVNTEIETFFNHFHIPNRNERLLIVLKGNNYDSSLLPLFLRNLQTADNVEQIIRTLVKNAKERKISAEKATENKEKELEQKRIREQEELEQKALEELRKKQAEEKEQEAKEREMRKNRNDYRQLFEAFYENGDISQKERGILNEKKIEYKLSEQEASRIEQEIINKYKNLWEKGVEKTKKPVQLEEKDKSLSQHKKLDDRVATQPEFESRKLAINPRKKFQYIAIAAAAVVVLLFLIWQPWKNGEPESIPGEIVWQSEKNGVYTDPRDEFRYNVVKIGGQIWFAENFAHIPHVAPPTEQGGIWVYDYHGNDVAEAMEHENYAQFACLYDFQSAIDLCPPGWRLPNDEDWKMLFEELGYREEPPDMGVKGGKFPMQQQQQQQSGEDEEIGAEENIGGKLKSDLFWANPNKGSTNESGFSALPAGARFVHDGKFLDIETTCYFWSDSYSMREYYSSWVLKSKNTGVLNMFGTVENGFSVRYIKE